MLVRKPVKDLAARSHREGGSAEVSSAVLRPQAEEALARSLHPGERVVTDVPATRGLSPWGAAALLAVSLAVSLSLSMAGLAGFLGWPHAGPVIAVAAPVQGLVIWLVLWFLRRPMYAALTDRRLVFCHLSRFRSTSRAPMIAVPFADLRMVRHHSSRYETSILCELPGRSRVLLHVSRGRRGDFPEVDRALTRLGVHPELDPPWPSAQI
jgi:hypothetical protein